MLRNLANPRPAQQPDGQLSGIVNWPTTVEASIKLMFRCEAQESGNLDKSLVCTDTEPDQIRPESKFIDFNGRLVAPEF